MVEILVTIIYDVNVFIIYGTLFENVINTLTIIYQNITKIAGKNRKLDKLFDYMFWWNYLDLCNKMDPAVQMRMSNNVKHHNPIYFKFGYSYITSLR